MVVPQKTVNGFNIMWNGNELGSRPFCRRLRSLHGMETQDSVREKHLL